MKNDTHVSDIDLPETFPDVDGEDGEGKGLKKGKIKKLNENKENSLWGAPFWLDALFLIPHWVKMIKIYGKVIIKINAAIQTGRSCRLVSCIEPKFFFAYGTEKGFFS